MLKFIKNLFGGDLLSEAGRSGDSEKLARLFLNSDITLLSIPVAQSLDPTVMTQDELLGLVESAAKKVSEETTADLFTYQDANGILLPIFTTETAAQKFVTEYVSEVKKIIPFLVMVMSGEVLLDYLSEDTELILNPKNPSEYKFSKKDLAALYQARS